MSNDLSEKKDDISLKLNILKKGIIEERKKNQLLQKELSAMKEKLNEKDEMISKLKSDYSNLSNNLAKSDPKAFYDTLMKQSESGISQADFQKLQKEVDSLKEEVSIYQEQNVHLKQLLEQKTVESDNEKINLNEQISTLSKELSETNAQIEENKLKIKVMTELFSEYETKKSTYESTIKALNEQLDSTIQKNSSLNKQVEFFSSTVAHLKDEIEKITSEKYKLMEHIEENKPITKEYVFKGKMCSGSKSPIEISFGKFEEAVVFNIKENEKVIDIKDINFIKVSSKKSNVIVISLRDKDNNPEILCEFTERECSYIVEFYNEMKSKFVKINSQIMSMAYGGDYY